MIECPHCHKNTPKDIPFCTSCGLEVGGEVSPLASPPARAVVTPVTEIKPQVAPPAPSPPVKPAPTIAPTPLSPVKSIPSSVVAPAPPRPKQALKSETTPFDPGVPEEPERQPEKSALPKWVPYVVGLGLLLCVAGGASYNATHQGQPDSGSQIPMNTDVPGNFALSENEALPANEVTLTADQPTVVSFSMGKISQKGDDYFAMVEWEITGATRAVLVGTERYDVAPSAGSKLINLSGVPVVKIIAYNKEEETDIGRIDVDLSKVAPLQRAEKTTPDEPVPSQESDQPPPLQDYQNDRFSIAIPMNFTLTQEADLSQKSSRARQTIWVDEGGARLLFEEDPLNDESIYDGQTQYIQDLKKVYGNKFKLQDRQNTVLAGYEAEVFDFLLTRKNGITSRDLDYGFRYNGQDYAVLIDIPLSQFDAKIERFQAVADTLKIRSDFTDIERSQIE